MRYWVYDDEGKLFRKFATKWEAARFLQPGWKLVTKPKDKPILPTVETHGEALW